MAKSKIVRKKRGEKNSGGIKERQRIQGPLSLEIQIQNKCLIGIDYSGLKLSKRNYRIKNLMFFLIKLYREKYIQKVVSTLFQTQLKKLLKFLIKSVLSVFPILKLTGNTELSNL